MQLILVRGASGVVGWSKVLIGARSWNWVCTRDGFIVAGPTDSTQVEAAAAAIIQHSAVLVGAISTLAQVDL